ncbi:hypothetical protein [Phaeobacter sp. 11ANDIMAR09]|uniref:hypothetical protein n=1 Tax=Phaeobacter sp. 11ANDIMAR09 TaxID=1225647 RepID=UPI0006C845EA|nr:hypothetical protein [Phaeobacter sp. 11ANDIMAR09]KPD11055.1 hypothetical protein AN476_17670 [Phaeobacter sp. 11ANDIMAR09]
MGDKSNKHRGEGIAISKIVNTESNRTVGWVYEWENGDVTNLWLTDKPKDFEFRSVSPEPKQSDEKEY